MLRDLEKETVKMTPNYEGEDLEPDVLPARMPNGKGRIIVTEIPYAVNKASMVEKIAALARDKQIEGITDLRDESNMNGVRVVMELRKDVQPEVILNQLYKLSPLQSNFSVNNVVLFDKVPRTASMKEMIQGYIDHQDEVIVNRTKYDLKKAEARAHILEGLRIAVDHLDEIIHIIRSSRDDAEATSKMQEQFSLSDIQCKAILDMQFRRLTGLAREKIESEYQDLLVKIADFKDILANHWRVEKIIEDELTEVKIKYADERRTTIIEGSAEMEDEDLIPVDDIVITMSSNGYIKRMTSDTYKVQNRGGKGIKGMELNKDDNIELFIHMSTHDNLLIFTNSGRVFRIKGYNIPQFSRTSKGLPIINLLSISRDEKVCALVPYSDSEEKKYLFFATKKGLVKRTSVEEFENINKNGKIAIKFNDDDALAFVKATSGHAEIIIAGSNGKAVRFNEETVRPLSRAAKGVKGFNVDGGEVIGLATNEEGKYILTITKNGFGKKSDLSDYRITSRGAKGVRTANLTDKTGDLVAMRSINGDEDCMIMTDAGIIIRISLKQISVVGRNTIGVKFINIKDGEGVSNVAILDPEDDSEDDQVEEPTEINE